LRRVSTLVSLTRPSPNPASQQSPHQGCQDTPAPTPIGCSLLKNRPFRERLPGTFWATREGNSREVEL